VVPNDSQAAEADSQAAGTAPPEDQGKRDSTIAQHTDAGPDPLAEHGRKAAVPDERAEDEEDRQSDRDGRPGNGKATSVLGVRPLRPRHVRGTLRTALSR